MTQYQYKVVPAPTKGVKAKGVRTPEGRFAHSVESVLNTLGADGWEYCRAELLPSQERSGLTGSVTNWRNVLVFRKLVGGGAEMFQPRVLDAIEPVAEVAQGAEELTGKAAGEVAGKAAGEAAGAERGFLEQPAPVAPAAAAPVAPAAAGPSAKPASPSLFRRDPPVGAAVGAPVAATGAERMLKDNGVEELSDVAGVTTALETLARQRTRDGADEPGSKP